MTIISKKAGKKKYAYLSVREGSRVVHKYIGPVDDPKVMKILSGKAETTGVPLRFRPLFWDTVLENIHINRNARYIIERVLEFGDLDAVEWLQKVYPVRKIADVLNLSKNVTEKSKNFWTIWFGVDYA
jgi:hypothetical protein